jgi:1-acyl-sn-glycerol-3-phosphate acyltransferase
MIRGHPLVFTVRLTVMKNRNLSPFEHLTSLLSFTFITLNLLFWLPWLILAALIRFCLPVRSIRRLMLGSADWIYRAAVKTDYWWLKHVLGIQFKVEDEDGVLAQLSPTDCPLVICNHQSWFDIFVLQSLISSSGPCLKFLIKRQLLFVPVLGWVCFVLNFPVLTRKSDQAARIRDRETVRLASRKLRQDTGALLLFPEGTRYSQIKHKEKSSSFRRLLNPKLGGFTETINSIDGKNRILDISISYGTDEASCWRSLSGWVSHIRVRAVDTSAAEIEDSADWLLRSWREKDRWLSASENLRWTDPIPNSGRITY